MLNCDNLRFRKDEISSSTSFHDIYSSYLKIKKVSSSPPSPPDPLPYLIDLPPDN